MAATADDIIPRIRTALWNEKIAPELLAFQHDLVLNIKERINEQQNEVDTHDSKEKLITCLFQMEIDRVKFLLASYLRVRLNKIESDIFYYLKSPGAHLLSSEELAFARKYGVAVEEHLQESVLKDIPADCSKLDTELQNVEAHAAAINRFVCMVAKEDVGTVEVGDRGDASSPNIRVENGDIMIVRYSKIQELIASGKANLI